MFVINNLFTNSKTAASQAQFLSYTTNQTTSLLTKRTI
jgi:hypothetical protein